MGLARTALTAEQEPVTLWVCNKILCDGLHGLLRWSIRAEAFELVPLGLLPNPTSLETLDRLTNSITFTGTNGEILAFRVNKGHEALVVASGTIHTGAILWGYSSVIGCHTIVKASAKGILRWDPG
jgi:hypothetical protein